MAVLEFSFHSKHCQREGDNDDIPNVAEIMCLQELHRHDASRSLFMFFSKYRILYVLWCTPMHKAMYSASKPTFPPFKRLSKQSSQNSHPPFGLNKELEECEGLYRKVIHSLYWGLAKPLHCTHNLSLRRNKGPKVNILSHNSTIFILDQNRDLHFWKNIHSHGLGCIMLSMRELS